MDRRRGEKPPDGDLLPSGPPSLAGCPAALLMQQRLPGQLPAASASQVLSSEVPFSLPIIQYGCECGYFMVIIHLNYHNKSIQLTRKKEVLYFFTLIIAGVGYFKHNRST